MAAGAKLDIRENSTNARGVGADWLLAPGLLSMAARGAERGEFLDIQELQGVKVERLESLQALLQQTATRDFASKLNDPAQRVIMIRELTQARDELKKMVGAEVTDPVVTNPIAQTNRLIRELGQYGGPAISRARAGSLAAIKKTMEDCLDQLESTIPYCRDKVNDAKGASIGSMTAASGLIDAGMAGAKGAVSRIGEVPASGLTNSGSAGGKTD